MNKYRVTTKEVYNVTYLVEADSEEEAKELGSQGEGIEVEKWYDDMLENYLGLDEDEHISKYVHIELDEKENEDVFPSDEYKSENHNLNEQ